MNLSVSAVRVRVPLRRPFTSAAGASSARDSWLVRLRDGEGREGVGEAALDPLAVEGDLARLAERIGDIVASGRPSAALADPDVLDQPGRAARAAVAAALVDGGWLGPGGDGGGHAGREARSGLPGLLLNATIDAVDLGDAAIEARAAVEAGFSTLKLKARAQESVDGLVERLAGIRSACGPLVRLRLDANGTWSVDEAATRLEAIAPFGIEYVEQPVATLAEMVALRRRVAVALAADELVSSPAAADAILDAEAADVLVVKPGRVGGPPVAAAIARHAAAHGVPVVVSTLLETGIGIVAAMRVAEVAVRDGVPAREGAPAGEGAPAREGAPALEGSPAREGAPALEGSPAHGLATAGLLVDDLVLGLPAIHRGMVDLPLPDGAGRPDDEAIRRFTVDATGDPW